MKPKGYLATAAMLALVCWVGLSVLAVNGINVDIPAGTYVNVSGIGWFQDGGTISVGGSATIKYQAYDAAKKYGAGWVTKNVADLGGVLAPPYCEMEVQIPVGTYVNIDGIGWKQNGDKLWMPVGAKVKYQAYDAARKYGAGWKYHTVDCSPLAPAYCDMQVSIPAGTYVSIDQIGWKQNGQSLQMPVGASVKYQAYDAAKKYGAGWKYHTVDCSPLAPAYCDMQVSIPAGTYVSIDQIGWKQNGQSLQMPVGASVKYQAYDAAKKYGAGWKYHTVDCSPLAPAYCDMQVSIPAGTYVSIDQIGWKQNGQPLQMPMGAKVKYQAYDAAKKYGAGWKYHTVDCSPLAPPYCAMDVQLEKNVWGKVNIDGIGWAYNGDVLQMPTGVKIKFRAYDVNGDATGWRYKSVDCTPLKPQCKVTVKLPDGVYVYLENIAYFQNGGVADVKPVKTFRYKLYDSTKKVSTGWKSTTFRASDCGTTWDLTSEFCEMLVDLDGSDGWVYIENVGYFQHGDKKWVPMGASFRYKAYDSTKKVVTGWKTKKVDCTALKPGFCEMLVDLDGSDGWVYIENVGYFQHGDKKWMPRDASFRYKAYDSTKKVVTGWQTKKVDCTPLKPGFCKMGIDLEGSDGWVYIENVGYFKDSVDKWMPSGASFRYKAYDSTKKVVTGWQTKNVDCTALKPGYCEMLVDLDGSDGWVYIENVDYFKHGDKKWVPMGASFRYKAYDSTKKVVTGWQTKNVDCTPLKPGFCEMLVSLERGVWGRVYIENVGYFVNADKKWMPVGASFRFKAYDANGDVTGWRSKKTDCTALVPICRISVKLPPGVYLNIQNVGWFQNGAEVEVRPVVATYYYLYDASKKVGTARKSHSFSASDCGKTWDLTGECCHMAVDLGGSDGVVNIQNVGDFKHGDSVWMPEGATLYYYAYNANKKVGTARLSKKVDCTPLAPAYCHMAVDLGGSDGVVNIQNVGDFKDGASVWMPEGATLYYYAYNANKKVGTARLSKKVDCTPLAPAYCHMAVDLGGSDGVVNIQNVGDFKDGASVWMPEGATLYYYAYNANKKVGTARLSKKVDCTPLAPAYCHMAVDLGGSDGVVNIQNVGDFKHGDSVWMPEGATLYYYAYNANKKVGTARLSKKVDCTPLAPGYCEVGIQLGDPYEWINIQNVGWYEDGDSVWMPATATFYYYAYDINKQNPTGRLSKAVDCSDLVYPTT